MKFFNQNKNTHFVIAGLGALVLLSGCSDDAGSTTTSNAGVSFATVSGVTAVLEGLYSKGCVVSSASSSYKSDTTFNGTTLSNSSAEYSDTTCTTETGSGVLEGTIAKIGTIAISGWDSIPTAADGSGQLANNETVTTIDWTISSATGFHSAIAVGTVIKKFYVVDDTGTKKVIYEDSDYAGRFGPESTLAFNDPSTEQ